MPSKIITNGRLEYLEATIDVTYPDIGEVTYRGSRPIIVSNQWTPPEKKYTDCLTFTGENSEFTLKATAKTWDGVLEWSTNHTTWTTLSGTEVMQSVRKKIYLRGKGNTTFENGDTVRWQLSEKAACHGNIQTLLDWENPPTTITKNYCYKWLFNGCENLTAAPELPATTLSIGCYAYMFSLCKNLTKAPELPATTLATRCYIHMFDNCINLIATPKLPATTLTNYCYLGMFYSCKELTSATELPATALTDGCYGNMFYGCTKLKVNDSSGNKIFTCPSAIPTGAVDDMFRRTGGSFTGTPTAGTTYYYTE